MVKFISAYNSTNIDGLVKSLLAQFNELTNVTYLDMQIVVIDSMFTGVIVYQENPVQDQKNQEVKNRWIGMQDITEPKTQSIINS